jgi:hypothetical protein
MLSFHGNPDDIVRRCLILISSFPSRNRFVYAGEK